MFKMAGKTKFVTAIQNRVRNRPRYVAIVNKEDCQVCASYSKKTILLTTVVTI